MHTWIVNLCECNSQGTDWFFPRMQALQNPRFTQAIEDMQRDPQAAVLKYQKDADISVMLQDFLAFLGSHFEEVAPLHLLIK